MANGFEPAARLPGELDLLAAVVADLREDTAKLAYADWLEERDDPRGLFLRRLVAAVRDGTAFPDPDDLPAGWLELLGFSLEARIRHCGREADRAAILAHARPAIAIDTEPADDDEFPWWASKFGGRPHLARGAEWPRCERSPLEFLAQFDLTELSRTTAGRVLPQAGLLSFFMYHDYELDAFGSTEPHGRGVPGGLQIIHTPPGTELQRLDPPTDWQKYRGQPGRPCRLTFTEALDLPFEWVPTREEEDETWGPVNAEHQLFGHPHVTVIEEVSTPGPGWEQLLRFNSDKKLGWGWGDGHRLFWYIRSADLRAGRFDDTFVMDG